MLQATAATLAVFRLWRNLAGSGFGGRRCQRRSLSVTLGNTPRVKSKLIIAAIIAAAALCGFSLGSYRTRQVWEEIAQQQSESQTRSANVIRVAQTVRALSYLAEGKQSEARDALEHQLDLGLAGVVAYDSLVSSPEHGILDILAIRQARVYRSQHPWTNDRPELVERVQKAFKWAN